MSLGPAVCFYIFLVTCSECNMAPTDMQLGATDREPSLTAAQDRLCFVILEELNHSCSFVGFPPKEIDFCCLFL